MSAPSRYLCRYYTYKYLSCSFNIVMEVVLKFSGSEFLALISYYFLHTLDKFHLHLGQFIMMVFPLVGMVFVPFPT